MTHTFGRHVIVAFGGGTDSTALLIEMVKRGYPSPHAILFADTGGEHPHTYRHIWLFSAWLVARGYPAITIVRAGRGETLEAMCLRLGVLPSIAYGWKTCSQRFKTEPQEKWLNNDPMTQAVRADGGRITMLVGFEYGEERRVKPSPLTWVTNVFPLIEWRMDREACVSTIRIELGYLPGKSSCFFCPNMKKTEVAKLVEMYPDLAERAVEMENNAARSGKSTKVVGLGRRYAWRALIAGQSTPSIAEPDAPCGCWDGDDDLGVFA